MIENEHLDQFLNNWQSVNRHLKKGLLTEGDERITRLQWMLLRHVSNAKNCTIGNLAEKFGVRPSTVSQMADRLEKTGLISRISNPQDARIRLVCLTEKGQAMIQNVESLWAKRLTDGLNQFTSEEQRLFLQLLEKLALSMTQLE